MAMDYNSLLAPKGTSGSILNWVGYGKIDTPVILDEAQFLLFEILRVREMRTEWTFGMTVGQSNMALPSRFLDPIGSMYDITNGCEYDHVIDSSIEKRRTYDSSISGNFGTDPFTTTIGSSLVTVGQTNQPFNQDSTITIAAAPVVNGLTMTGTFRVVSVTDTNDFVIDTGDTLASASGTGGGAGVKFTGNNLVSSAARCWGVWNEKAQFDCAFDTPAAIKLLYYRRPALLSTTNATNFLTDRYPKLLRVACLASAAEYMKDDGEYTKQVGALNNLISTTAASDDLSYRGASFGTDTPYGR